MCETGISSQRLLWKNTEITFQNTNLTSFKLKTHLTWLGVFEDKVLILKLPSIYGFPPSAVVIGEISTLAHKLRDDSVEAAALESKALLMCA